MTRRTLAIDGVEVPCSFYGTAWKEDRTQDLTELALARGLRGIDTANQRRHYDEAAVGRAISDRRVSVVFGDSRVSHADDVHAPLPQPPADGQVAEEGIGCSANA